MNLFKIDSFPYLLTILFSLTSWSLTKIVDSLIQSPVLEYKDVEKNINADTNEVYYEITNISNHVVKDLTFKLNYFDSAQGQIFDAQIYTAPPAFKENLNVIYDEDRKGYAKYTIPQMQPGWTYLLEASTAGNTAPVFSFSSDSGETINLKRTGFNTFLIKNQDLIILSSLIMWVVIIIFYLIWMSRASSMECKLVDYESQI